MGAWRRGRHHRNRSYSRQGPCGFHEQDLPEDLPIRRLSDCKNSRIFGKDRKASAELFERALALYRGAFCADVAEECLENARFLYRDRQLKIQKKLGAHYLNDKQYQKALEFLEPASNLDEFDEGIHTDIIRCYAGLGDRKGIQKRYDILTGKLKELGIDTPPESAAEIVRAIK